MPEEKKDEQAEKDMKVEAIIGEKVDKPEDQAEILEGQPGNEDVEAQVEAYHHHHHHHHPPPWLLWVCCPYCGSMSRVHAGFGRHFVRCWRCHNLFRIRHHGPHPF